MHGHESETPQRPPDDVTVVATDTVACDGGDGPLGHPRIYLPLPAGQVICCPYCSRRYLLAAGARPAEH